MLIDQADLLWGMDKLFVREFMGITTTVNFGKGDVVFRFAEPSRKRLGFLQETGRDSGPPAGSILSVRVSSRKLKI